MSVNEVCRNAEPLTTAAIPSCELNIVFIGTFPYPKGMAATRHLQLIIDGLRCGSDVSTHVVVLRQSSKLNTLSGTHQGTPYETVMGDTQRGKAILLASLLRVKARQTIDRLFRRSHKNVLFVHGSPAPDNVPVVRHARHLGYKVVFYVVEDADLAWGVSASPWHWLQLILVRHATRKVTALADAILVISSHLEAKFRRLTHDSLPIYYKTISVDMDRFPDAPPSFAAPITLFYSGSFGLKDGVPVLIDAFDKLATKDGNVRLVLTGKGDEEAQRKVMSRINVSPHRDRIDYRGYLDDDAYHAALNTATIPCMTRIDIGYANAGFPFKLGEYLATGKPVIASRVSDVGALFNDREEIMLVKPGDSEDIVRAVEYLSANPVQAGMIGQRGREKARHLFDHRQQGRTLLRFLTEL